jgi:hypothetical protein
MLEVRLQGQAARWPRSSCVLAEGGKSIWISCTSRCIGM